jgi:hypothetical protein
MTTAPSAAWRFSVPIPQSFGPSITRVMNAFSFFARIENSAAL